MIDWNRWYQYQQTMPLWQWGVVIVAVSVAIWLIVRLRSYFREDADDADQTLEMLTQFRDLHQQGGLSDDEFRLIRSRLAISVQAARVTEGTRPKTNAVEREFSKSMDSPNDTSQELPAIHATVKDEANSERMTENETD